MMPNGHNYTWMSLQQQQQQQHDVYAYLSFALFRGIDMTFMLTFQLPFSVVHFITHWRQKKLLILVQP
jgi:hypothetical protein